MNSPPLLLLDAVRKKSRRDGTLLFDALTLSLSSGDTLAVVGGEGSGLTTLARLATGLEAPDRGRVLLEGEPLEQWDPQERAARIGLLWQIPEEGFLGATVWEEVALDPAGRGVPEAELRQRVEAAMALAGLPVSMSHLHPLTLSPSFRARIGLAAVLAQRPRLLVADEPGWALSTAGEESLAATLRRVCCEWGMALLVVTSRPERGRRFASRLESLSGGRVIPFAPRSKAG
ncbi:MAG: ABC transporter ATP-binding protein [Magnetococcales bacterium]|nr:ABC transporter ATP-binding protein [Magnetococcales bacterium]